MNPFFNKQLFKKNDGQVLIEILVAVVVAGIIIGGVAMTIGSSLSTSKKTRYATAATNISQEDIEAIKLVGESSWITLYCLPSGSCPGSKTSDNHYKMVFSNNTWTISSGEATTTVENVIYTHYFYVDNVYRNDNGDVVASGGDEDPSTQKITIVVSWSGQVDFTVSEYLMRTTSAYLKDFNWSTIGDGPYTSSSGNYSTTSGDIMLDSNRAIKLNI